MERGFPSFLVDGEANNYEFPPEINSMSFQSLVNSNQEITLMPSPDYCNYTASFYSPALNFTSLNQTESKLKMPKQEPDLPVTEQILHPLPDLRSFEFPTCFSAAESSQKRFKQISLPSLDPYSLTPIFNDFQVSGNFNTGKSPDNRNPTANGDRVKARAKARRQRISDKTQCLQKLLPWDRKMDIATTLEEACKYVKFLKAQVSVLQSMPCYSSSFSTQYPRNLHVFGGLGSLNRQQLLEVLVNSPAAQTRLCSQGYCVFSIEQVELLKKMMENKNGYYQQLGLHPSMLH